MPKNKGGAIKRCVRRLKTNKKYKLASTQVQRLSLRSELSHLESRRLAGSQLTIKDVRFPSQVSRTTSLLTTFRLLVKRTQTMSLRIMLASSGEKVEVGDKSKSGKMKPSIL